jgi:hypothetical protein
LGAKKGLQIVLPQVRQHGRQTTRPPDNTRLSNLFHVAKRYFPHRNALQCSPESSSDEAQQLGKTPVAHPFRWSKNRIVASDADAPTPSHWANRTLPQVPPRKIALQQHLHHPQAMRMSQRPQHSAASPSDSSSVSFNFDVAMFVASSCKYIGICRHVNHSFQIFLFPQAAATHCLHLRLKAEILPPRRRTAGRKNQFRS